MIIRAGQDAQSIAEQFKISKRLFEENNYCYYEHGFAICPLFYPGLVSFWILDEVLSESYPFSYQTVCIARSPIGKLPKCEKIF